MVKRKADTILGDPILRHKDCSAIFTPRRLAFRHGMLAIDPLYCRHCGGALTRFTVEPYNESARYLFIKLEIIPDPQKIPVDIQVDF